MQEKANQALTMGAKLTLLQELKTNTLSFPIHSRCIYLNRRIGYLKCNQGSNMTNEEVTRFVKVKCNLTI